MSTQFSSIDELLKTRRVNLEFVAGLEITDVRRYPMPGAIIKNPGIPQIKIKQGDEVVLAEHVATIHHRSTTNRYIVYQDTVEALFLESLDPIKYPMWLLESEQKQKERSIRISYMIRPPKDRYDREWLGDIDEPTFESIFYFAMPQAWRSRL